MRKHDHYACYLVHGEMEKLHGGPMRKSRVDWAKDQRNVIMQGS